MINITWQQEKLIAQLFQNAIQIDKVNKKQSKLLIQLWETIEKETKKGAKK